MKSFVSKLAVGLLVVALTSVVALAKVHKHSVTFDSDTKVGDTLVKKGEYQVRFDDESGQLSIIKNGKTIAQATTKLEQREKKAEDFQVRSRTEGSASQLVGVTFGGWDKDVVITGNGASTSGTN